MTGKSATTNCYDAIEVWTDKPKPIREALETITDGWIDDGQLCRQTALDLRDACKKMIEDYDRIKAEVIRMREKCGIFLFTRIDREQRKRFRNLTSSNGSRARL